jgi:hypothetical protein
MLEKSFVKQKKTPLKINVHIYNILQACSYVKKISYSSCKYPAFKPLKIKLYRTSNILGTWYSVRALF